MIKRYKIGGGSVIIDYEVKAIIFESQVDYNLLTDEDHKILGVRVISGIEHPVLFLNPESNERGIYKISDAHLLIGCFLAWADGYNFTVIGAHGEDAGDLRYYIGKHRVYADKYNKIFVSIEYNTAVFFDIGDSEIIEFFASGEKRLYRFWLRTEPAKDLTTPISLGLI